MTYSEQTRFPREKPDTKASRIRRSGLLLRLDPHQPVGWLRKNRKRWQLAPHHGNFIAVIKSRTYVAVLIYLVGKIVPPRHFEALPRKKLRSPRKQADAIHSMPLGFRHQSFHQPAAAPMTLRPRSHGDRANLRQVSAIKMQRPTSNNAAFVFEHHEVSYVLANLSQGSGQQGAVPGIGRD